MADLSTPESVSIRVDGATMPADLYLPESGEGPGMVVYQEIFGVTDYISSRARDLAALGYVVLVPHLYHRLGDEVVQEGGEGLPRAMELMNEFDWEQGVKDGVAALAAVRARDEVRGPAGVIGFCFGGGMAFNVAAAAKADRAAPDALVSYYGSALPNLLELAPEVTSPSLHHFGTADDYIPMDKVEEIEAAVTAGNDDVSFLTYEGAGHAFDNPSPMFHHEAASSQAWVATESFLLEKLPV